MDKKKLLLQLLILDKPQRLCYFPLKNSNSAIAKDYRQIVLDGKLQEGFLLCNTCHLVLKFVSIDRSYSSLKAHRNRCQKKLKSAQTQEVTPSTQPSQQTPSPHPPQNRFPQPGQLILTPSNGIRFTKTPQQNH
jgi:hypothetical protein